MSVSRLKNAPAPAKTSSPAPTTRPAQPARSAAPPAVPGWKPAAAGSARPATTGFDAGSAVKQAAQVVASAVDKEVLDGVDGYVAFDPAQARFLSGDTGGVEVRDDHLSWLLPKGLATILASGDGGEKVSLSVKSGARVDSGKTDGHGFQPTTLAELQQLGTGGLDARRGGLLKISAQAEGQATEQRVLALPRNYDGPIFVSDIDDTLRPTQVTDVVKGAVQAPIPGARELLQGVADRGVPIVYLSAGPQRMGSLNDEFLQQMPEGVLLARPNMDLAGFSPRNADQACSQGDYKAQRLAELRATFPNAKIFGLGDDKYGDANAYTAAGAKAYIHDVRPGSDNIPAAFQGTMTKDYDPAFRGQLLGDLDQAIAASASFKP